MPLPGRDGFAPFHFPNAKKGKMPKEDSVKFECPHCAQSIEAPAEMRGVETQCPACGKPVTVPAVAKKAVQAGVASASTPASRPIQWPWKPEASQEPPGKTQAPEPSRTRGAAGLFILAAKSAIVIYGVAAAIGGALAMAANAGNEKVDCSWMLYAGAAAFGVAGWCYLTAQIVYIRAALEK